MAVSRTRLTAQVKAFRLKLRQQDGIQVPSWELQITFTLALPLPPWLYHAIGEDVKNQELATVMRASGHSVNSTLKAGNTYRLNYYNHCILVSGMK
jgi:hypothetical protein